MRILQLIGGLDASGAEAVVVNLANGLHDAGHEVAVCARMTGALATRLRVPLHIISKGRTVDLAYATGLCRLVRELRVDVIHSHLFGNDLYAVPLSLATRRPLVVTIHGADAIQSWKRRFAYCVIGRLAHRVATVSEALRDEFAAPRYGIGSRLLVVRNGIPLGRDFVDPSRDTRRDLAIEASARIVVAVGNIKRVKGYEVLLDALARVREAVPDSVLVIAGAPEDEQYRRELENQRAALGLDSAVRFVGSLPNVAELLRVAEVCVNSSHYEGTSLALLEAMAAGKPVVATAVGGTRNLIQHGRTGRLVPPSDAGGLAAEIIGLLKEPAIGRQLGCAAESAVRSAFELEAMVGAYADVYREVLECSR